MVVILSLQSFISSCSGLMCHYCYSAEIKADCHLNALQCPAQHVCFVETNRIWYATGKSYMQYKMGCEHYSVCQDRVSHGERPIGYTVSNKTCCCTSLCEQPDGVGKDTFTKCPAAWENSANALGKPSVLCVTVTLALAGLFLSHTLTSVLT